jgi:OOP family OmpA-OmpF porin
MNRPHRSIPGSLALLAGLALLTLAGRAGAAEMRRMIPDALTDPKAVCYKWPAGDWDGDGVFDRLDRCPNTPKGCAVDEYGCPHDADGDGVCDELDRCPGTPRGARVDEHGCEQGAARQEAPPPAPTPPPPPPPAPPEPRSEFERKLVRGEKIRFENINFETGSANLLPSSRANLDEAGEVLERYPDLRVEIEGHTDSRGKASSNMKLSQERAESVRRYLLDHYKLDRGHLTARGYGETQLLNDESNDAERLQNRRVELRVLNPEVLPGNVKIVK